jgi:protein-S-isoprenylcysteine O-methyltransferase Ste14
MSSYANKRPVLLPPRGLLLALLCQLPGIVLALPLQPSLVEILSGAVLLAVGIGLNVWADLHFKRAKVEVCPFATTPAVIAGGPFVFTRNPMYLGLIAISVGIAVATGVLSNVWISAALAIWLHYAYVLPEEDFLRGLFGEDYERYQRRAPRWLPDISGIGLSR